MLTQRELKRMCCRDSPKGVKALGLAQNGYAIGELLCASVWRMLDALFSDLRRPDYS